MPCREVHGPSDGVASKADEPSVAPLSSPLQPVGLYVSAVATTRIAFLEFMSQCTLAWIDASTGHTATRAPDHRDEQVTQQVRMSTRSANRAVRISGSEWLSMPVITGIEETLSDQFIKPRPIRAQESEVLALWKRSNEFEVAHFADNTGPVDTRRDIV